MNRGVGQCGTDTATVEIILRLDNKREHAPRFGHNDGAHSWRYPGPGPGVQIPEPIVAMDMGRGRSNAPKGVVAAGRVQSLNNNA